MTSSTNPNDPAPDHDHDQGEYRRLIERARELTEDIYPGPWIDDVDGDDGGLRVFNPDHPYDAFYIWFGDMEETEGIDHRSARFVSNARQLVPDLANALERAAARIDELEKDGQDCIVGLKELRDNMLTTRNFYPIYSEDWFDRNSRFQAYQTAYIRAKNMLDWEGSGKSYVHFKEEADQSGQGEGGQG